MKRYRRYIGNWEISWNQTTWKAWCPMIAAVVMLSVGLLSLLALEIVIYVKGL
jgi:hypothetical protein